MVAEFSSKLNLNVNARQPLTPQPTREERIAWLLSLGLSPLPVAPAQDPHIYPLKDKSGAVIFEKDGVTPKPKFCGKNPSYIDAKGKPQIVPHGKYQNRQPTEKELEKWFRNLETGVGTLGSDESIWLDFDVKHFNDEVECHVKAWAIAAKVKELSGHEPTLERTHSGGWRVQVYVEEKPTFTNFALTPGGKYVGEALGAGRFTVLAPTTGPSGNPYEAYHRHSPESKPVVRCLEDIGVYASSSKSKSKEKSSTAKATPKPTSVYVPGSVRLSQLASSTAQNILRGFTDKDNRSEALTTALNELYGWANWCLENGKPYAEDVEALAYEAGQRLGLDADRVGRILKTINVTECRPALEYKGKDCLKLYNTVAKANGVKVSANANGSNANANAPANGKVITLPTTTSLPKAVGDNGGVPPVPPTYGSGRGGSNPNDDVDWKAPIAYKGQLGVWKYPKNGEPEFDAKCNFDFVVLKEFERYVPEDGEPSDPDGGGLQIKVTRASDGKTKTLLITSQDYGTAKTFTAALKKGLGLGIKSRLSDYDLQALLHTKVWEYHRKGGKVYTLASLVGQQPDGTWVFPKVKFTPSGQIIEKDTNLWVFNAKVSTTNDLPYPDIPKTQDVKVLKELIEAIREVAGVNWQRWVLALGWVAMQLNRYHIPHSYLPILAAFGVPGGGKTRMALAALSIIWGVDEKKAMLRKTTESYLYEILSRLTIPFLWDDAKATTRDERKVIESVIVDVYGQLSRRVRGLPDQTPHTSPLLTSNPQLGDVLDAALSRLANIFVPKGGISNDPKSLRRLQNAKRNAPQAFSSVIGIGFNEDSVEEITHALMPHLAEAHERTPHHLGVLVYYTQKVLALAGVEEEILPWVIKEYCADVSAEQSGTDSLTDFFERLSAAKASRFLGPWCGRVTTGHDGVEYLALHMKQVWPAITKVGGEPSSYNQRMIERLLRDKGAKSGTVRLWSNKLEADAYAIAITNGKDPDELVPPKEVPQMCLKIPVDVYKHYLKLNDPVINSPLKIITESTPDAASVSASTSTSNQETCNKSPEKIITSQKSDPVSVLLPSVDPCNKSNESNKESVGSVEKKFVVEGGGGEKTLASDEAKKHTELDCANSVPLPPESLLHSLQAPNAKAETTTPHKVDDVINSVINSPCNKITSDYVEENALTPPDDNLIKLGPIATEMIHCASNSDVEKLYATHSTEAIEAAKEILGNEERQNFEAIATPAANLLTDASDAELIASAKRQGKIVQRYVGKLMTSGANCLAPNTLVELLGVDRFGLLVEVQRLGENWEQPIGVGAKFLEEVSD